MALTFSNIGTNNSTTSSATLAVGTVTASVGEWLLVCVAADNNGTGGAASLSSVTDSAGNTYTLQGSLANQDPGTAASGATLGIYLAEITSALSSGTVTANFSPNTAAKAMTVQKIVAGAGERVAVYATGAGATGSGTAFSAGAVSVLNGHTIFGATAVEATAAPTADSDTTNGNWSTAYTAAASTGTNSTSMSVSSQQKTVNATGNQTYNTSAGGTRDWAANYVILYPAPILAADAGNFSVTGAAAAVAPAYVVNGYWIFGYAEGDERASLAAATGSFTLTGTDATLKRGLVVSGGAGSFAVTGGNAAFAKGYRFPADGAAFALSGQDATFALTRKVAADAGAFALTGAAAALSRGRFFAADAGAVAVTGADAAFERGYAMAASGGSFTLAGADAAFIRGRIFVADAGQFDLTGGDAGFSTSFPMGIYALTGGEAQLVKVGLVANQARGRWARMFAS